ncbi:MAG: hypothetical protein ABI543_02785 [Ignavibacteria bacterium]
MLKRIEVYSAAPRPIRTPIIPAAFPPIDVSSYGMDFPLGRAGQPEETAPRCVFKAVHESFYTSGQILHLYRSNIVNG